MAIKKLLWILKRHPFLYVTRFKLLSKPSGLEAIDRIDYNTLNPKEAIPSYFAEVNARIFSSGTPETDLERVTRLCLWLFEHIKGGPGLSEPSDKALRIMLEGKGGVCSDVAQSFNNFCVLNGIKVREWGTTRAPFDKSFGGHSFNEFYSKELDKWLMVDVYNCLYFYNGNEEVPLSVTELYTRLRQGKPCMYKSFNPQKAIDDRMVYRNFTHPDTVPFLICNYSNATYDKFLRRYRPYLPVFVIHYWLYITRRSYYYLFPFDDYKKMFD